MKILFLGDFFYDYEYTAGDIEKISSWIKQNNLYTILNLETVIDYNDDKDKIKKRGPNLSSNIISIDILKKLNVIGVNIANNHIMDYGKEGLLHTIDLLNKNNIQHTGAGLNIVEACKPIVIEYNSKKIAIFGFGWNIEETIYADCKNAGCAPKNENIILSTINKKKYDNKIVCMHWGFEYNRLPMPLDIKLGHLLIDNGVDLIIGHHSHCIQAKELYKNKRIYYSLGNFYFSSRRNKFNKKFEEKVENQCDYGMGVIFDTNSFDSKEIKIIYDNVTDKTIIKEEKIEYIIEDLSQYNYKKNSYIKLCKKNKQNINPILNNNKIFDLLKLFLLFSIYYIKDIIKKVIRWK